MSNPVITRRGFTLIELLIVVAIIAILAAIAVPNFLEAQVRAKVSRVKSDMRSMATAMESYAVDHNRYPIPSDPEGNYIADPIGAVGISPFETRVPITLTTPIAYLSSRFYDPFVEKVGTESALYHTIMKDYVDIRQANAPAHNWSIVYLQFFREVTGRNPPAPVKYFFVSFGPDKKHDADVPHTATPTVPHTHGNGALYDPTNGTVSAGDILYFGPGLGFLTF